jgi:hypothetical protein
VSGTQKVHKYFTLKSKNLFFCGKIRTFVAQNGDRSQEDLEAIIIRQEATIDSLHAKVCRLSALLDKLEGN